MACVAVSWEHLAMRAHLATVRLPLKSSIRRVRPFIWRSLMGTVGDGWPEPGPGQDGCHGCVGAVEGTFQAAQEPRHPRGDVGPILLGLLEDAVVLGALRVDLGGHAVEALGSAA